MLDNPDWLDDVDGLPVICCDIQMRVQQIIVEHKVFKTDIVILYFCSLKISADIYIEKMIPFSFNNFFS